MVRRISRREFLTASAGASIALVTGCTSGSGRAPAPTIAAPDTSDQGETDEVAVPDGPVIPTHADVWLDDIFITPTEVFYLQHYRNTPAVQAEQWSLRVDGLVENPMTLSFDDIKAFPRVEKMRSLECIGNPTGGELIGNTMWAGFLIEDLLKEVGVKDEVVRARFDAADGYATAVDMQWMLQPGTMLVYEMGGEPLTASHGFPLRILMNGLYGQKMPKWITRIEFIDFEFQGYWETRGWSDVADVQTNSLVFSPPDLAQVAGDSVAIQGVAYAGNRDIPSVEVQINSDPWQAATLVKGPNDQVWTQWYLQWSPPAPGTYIVGVRATDDDGFTQFKESSGLLGGSFPNGTDEIHRVRVNIS